MLNNKIQEGSAPRSGAPSSMKKCHRANAQWHAPPNPPHAGGNAPNGEGAPRHPVGARQLYPGVTVCCCEVAWPRYPVHLGCMFLPSWAGFRRLSGAQGLMICGKSRVPAAPRWAVLCAGCYHLPGRSPGGVLPPGSCAWPLRAADLLLRCWRAVGGLLEGC